MTLFPNTTYFVNNNMDSEITTSLALLDFTEQITNATERHEYTTDHKLLLSKLQKYGIRGLAHD